MVTSGASDANKNTVLSIKTVPDVSIGGGATTTDISYEKYSDIANAIVSYLEQHPDTPINYTKINGLSIPDFKNKVFNDLHQHEHINKDLLDTITVSFVSKYDSKQDAISYTPLDTSKKNTNDGYVGLNDKGIINKDQLLASYKATGKFVVVPNMQDLDTLDKNLVDVGSTIWVETTDTGNPIGLVCINKNTDPITTMPFIAFHDTSSLIIGWDEVQNKPDSAFYDIDNMVNDSHVHLNKAIIEELKDIDDDFKYKIHHLIYQKDRARVFIQYTHEFDLDEEDIVTSTIIIPPYKHRKTVLYRVEYGGIKLIKDIDYTFNESTHELSFITYRFNGSESLDIMLYVDIRAEHERTLYTVEDMISSKWEVTLGGFDPNNSVVCYNPKNKKLFLFPPSFKNEASPVTPINVYAVDVGSFAAYNEYNINTMFQPADDKTYEILKVLYCDHLDRMYIFIAEKPSLDFKVYYCDTNMIGMGAWNLIYSSDTSAIKFIDNENGAYKLGVHYFKDIKKIIMFRNNAISATDKDKISAISDDCSNWMYNMDSFEKKPLSVDSATYLPKCNSYLVGTTYTWPSNGNDYTEAYVSTDGLRWRKIDVPKTKKFGTFVVTDEHIYNMTENPHSPYMFNPSDYFQMSGFWQLPNRAPIVPNHWQLPVYVSKWNGFICIPSNNMSLLAFSKTMRSDSDRWYENIVIPNLQSQNTCRAIPLGDDGVVFWDQTTGQMIYPIIPE